MFRFILSAVWLTVACVAIAEEPQAVPGKDSEPKERPSFAGTWEITEVHPEGASKQAVFISFTRDGTYAALDKDGQELWGGTYEIVPTTTPRMWDH